MLKRLTYGVFVLAVCSTARAGTHQGQKAAEVPVFYAVCADGDSDPDGDGWGWERVSCRVGGGEGVPTCGNPNSDPDGDGWGWEAQSCRVAVFKRSHRDNHHRELRIVSLYVSHGDATLVFLPSGEIALVDSGQSWATRKWVLPFMERHGITELDYYLVTHYHGDHYGEKDRIIRDYRVKNFWDYKTFNSGAEIDFGGTRMTILNAYADGSHENDSSLSFRLEYNGFVYALGADIYANSQQRIIDRFPEKIRAHVYRTNHHLHGSVNKDYLLRVDPYLFVTSAEWAVYYRDAYTRDFQDVLRQLRGKGGRVENAFLTHEVGHVVIWAHSADDWNYASYRPEIEPVIPELVQRPRGQQSTKP
jgi:beta-lactamase superfamily II metal-dependent hydrolase